MVRKFNIIKDKILLILKDNYYNINVSVQTWDSECTGRDA